MQYKTIVLELLMQRPPLYEQLRKERKLMSTIDCMALDLKASHEAWKETLLHTTSQSDSVLITSQAMEMAVRELEERLLLQQLKEEP